MLGHLSIYYICNYIIIQHSSVQYVEIPPEKMDPTFNLIIIKVIRNILKKMKDDDNIKRNETKWTDEHTNLY